MGEQGRYSVTFTDAFHAANWTNENHVERELKKKCEEIVSASDGRQINKVTYLVDWTNAKVGLEREGWDIPPEAA
jgi:tRNA A37 threonylcarbamoyladenosine synthetase subunit TsaC/SUA5/YrdC